jgi:hypothetical protein
MGSDDAGLFSRDADSAAVKRPGERITDVQREMRSESIDCLLNGVGYGQLRNCHKWGKKSETNGDRATWGNYTAFL